MPKVREPAIGVVQKVFVHDSVDDFSNHEANVRLVNNEEELRRIPIHVEHQGHAIVPQKGDAVQVNFLGSEGQSGYVDQFIHTSDNRSPLARSGHYRHRFGDNSPYLFIEAETSDHSGGTPDVVRLAKKQDGLSDPSTQVAIDDSGSTTKVSIETDGDITISADGDIVIDEGGSTTPVAKQDHDHDVTRSDGSTTTTSQPNQSGTDVELE